MLDVQIVSFYSDKDELDSGFEAMVDCDEDSVDTSVPKRSLEELVHILKSDVTRVITFSNAEMEVIFSDYFIV